MRKTFLFQVFECQFSSQQMTLLYNKSSTKSIRLNMYNIKLHAYTKQTCWIILVHVNNIHEAIRIKCIKRTFRAITKTVPFQNLNFKLQKCCVVNKIGRKLQHTKFWDHPLHIASPMTNEIQFYIEDQAKWNRILKAVDILPPSTLFTTHLKLTFKLSNANWCQPHRLWN